MAAGYTARARDYAKIARRPVEIDSIDCVARIRWPFFAAGGGQSSALTAIMGASGRGDFFFRLFSYRFDVRADFGDCRRAVGDACIVGRQGAIGIYRVCLCGRWADGRVILAVREAFCFRKQWTQEIY